MLILVNGTYQPLSPAGLANPVTNIHEELAQVNAGGAAGGGGGLGTGAALVDGKDICNTNTVTRPSPLRQQLRVALLLHARAHETAHDTVAVRKASCAVRAGETEERSGACDDDHDAHCG